MLCLKILYDIIKRGVSKMKALITGASSGLGREMAKVLSEKGGKEILEQIRMELNP